MDIAELKLQCAGRWFGILSSLGINVRNDGRHESCPICRDGVDRFRMEKDGSGYYCNQCPEHAGDTIKLIQKCLGCNFPEVIEKIQSIIGGCEVQTLKPDQNIEQKKANLNKLWQASTDLTGSCPVSKYFHGRGLNLTPSHIRYCPVCYEPDTGKEYPAIIAKILNFEGKPVGLQRIYLTDENIGSKKKLMPNTENLNGAAIRLFEPANELFDTKIIGIAEGICTAMAAAQMHGVAVWSCISNILMESWMPPVGIRHIIVFSDNDSSFAGQKSAYILANKLYSKDFIVEVVVPDQIGQDFNDVLKSS
jgi:putative DNA primase/helicase